MTWNYRVIRRKHGEKYNYAIHETYYRDDGSIIGFSKNPAPVTGEDKEYLKTTLQWMGEALARPMIDSGTGKEIV